MLEAKNLEKQISIKKIDGETLSIKIFDNINDALNIDKFKGFTVATPAETHYHITKKIILKVIFFLLPVMRIGKR